MKLEHPDFVKSIALAGPYVITGGRQETVRVWSIAVSAPKPFLIRRNGVYFSFCLAAHTIFGCLNPRLANSSKKS